MDRQRIYHIIEWGVAIAACGWLVWKLATYEDYASLWECLRAMGWQQWLALAVCVALMPVNMALEAWRWRTLWNEGGKIQNCETMSFAEAQRQVYYSKLAGLITPWRLGEYPARGILLMNGEGKKESGSEGVEGAKSGGVWTKVLSMGAVGSATMTMAIVIAGLGGMAFSPKMLAMLGDSYLYALGLVIAGTAVVGGLGWYYGKRALASTVGSPSVDRREFADLFIKSVGQSLVRLACWCVQLGLVLWALEASDFQLPAEHMIAMLPVYYLLVTVTPNVPIAEAGVRGAWAIVVFGSVNAALAGVLLWVINTLLPCAVWFGIKRKQS